MYLEVGIVDSVCVSLPLKLSVDQSSRSCDLKKHNTRGKTRLKENTQDECRYNEILNVVTEGSKRLGYTGLRG